MISEAQRLTFHRAFYEWSLRDFMREINQDYPFVRGLGEQGHQIVSILTAMLPECRDWLARVFVKRMSEYAIVLERETLNDTEHEAIKWFQDQLVLSDWMTSGTIAGPTRRAKRGALRGLVKHKVEPVLGPPGPESDQNVLQFATEYRQWVIGTEIDLGGRYHQLCYEHAIWLAEGTSVHRDGADVLLDGTSVLSWLGISGQTHWSEIAESDAPAVAETLAQLCRHFLDAVRPMLDTVS